MKFWELRHVAMLYCPIRPLNWYIAEASWGLGHELAHALLASERERRRKTYGLPSFSEQIDDPTAKGWRYSFLVEASATWLSNELHRCSGVPGLIEDERKQTDMFSLALIDTPKMRSFVARRGCASVPSTREALVTLCHKRGLRPDCRRLRLYAERGFEVEGQHSGSWGRQLTRIHVTFLTILSDLPVTPSARDRPLPALPRALRPNHGGDDLSPP